MCKESTASPELGSIQKHCTVSGTEKEAVLLSANLLRLKQHFSELNLNIDLKFFVCLLFSAIALKELCKKYKV